VGREFISQSNGSLHLHQNNACGSVSHDVFYVFPKKFELNVAQVGTIVMGCVTIDEQCPFKKDNMNLRCFV
jgi:hypothetical protein